MTPPPPLRNEPSLLSVFVRKVVMGYTPECMVHG